VNAQLTTIRNLDVANGTDQRTHYYGLVLQDGGKDTFFMRGCSAIPSGPDPSAVGSGPTGPTGINIGPLGSDWDNDGSWGDWYGGHELGHTFGRLHVPGGCREAQPDPNYPYTQGHISGEDGAFVGFDRGDTAGNISAGALPGRVWTDVMSYCPKEWLSRYTYTAIMQRLREENAFPEHLGSGALPVAANLLNVSPVSMSGAGPAAPDGVIQQVVDEIAPPPIAGPGPVFSTPTTRTEGDFIAVVGTINLTRRTGRIDFVRRLGSANVLTGAGATDLRLRVIDSGGRLAAEVPAVFRPSSDREPGEDVIGTFEAVIAARPDLKAVELLAGSTVVTRYEPPISGAPNPSELRVLSPPAAAAANNAAGSSTAPLLKLEWGSPAAGPAAASAGGAGSGITYDVQASRDHGRTWQTLAVQVPTPSTEIDIGEFRDAPEVSLRVIGNNGFDSKVIAERKILK
jgi:hypothetical protein